MTGLRSDRRVQVGACVLVVILVAGGVVFAGSRSSRPAASGNPTATVGVTTSIAVGLPGTPTTTTTAGAPTPTSHDPRVAIATLPLEVSISSTKGLRDGDQVTLHVVPKGDAKIFGGEARLCVASAAVQNSGDFLPTQGGLCIGHPLSSGSDARTAGAAQPPYKSFDLAFRVGVGTDTYAQDDGTPTTIACGPGHACQLVVKLQVPGGFGFLAYPLSFA